MSRRPRLLIVDGYSRNGRDRLMAIGASIASELYANSLAQCLADFDHDVLFCADANAAMPPGVGIADYDGIVWTGSSLRIHETSAKVARQIDFARQVYAAGVPSFGSCWAAQVAVVAAGGVVAANPRGREFGIGRDIILTDAGRSHPLYAGKPDRFDALTFHLDEIVTLPREAVVLAANDMSWVQAVAITYDAGTFWAPQYHPEFTPGEVGRLIVGRADSLVGEGHFPDRAAALFQAEQFAALEIAPDDAAPARTLAAGPGVTDAALRQREIKNWFDAMVCPNL